MSGNRRVTWALLAIWTFFCAALRPEFAIAQDQAIRAEVCETDDASELQLAWKQFAVAGACVELSGSASFIYQKILDSKADRIPVFSTRRGPVFPPVPSTLSGGMAGQPTRTEQSSYLNTGDFSVRIDTTRKTAAGDLATGFEMKYEKTSSDDGNGVLTLTEGIVTWAGIKVGYTDSLMDFWSGDFQFSATAPGRTVGLASYDIKLAETVTLTLAGETGVPTSREGAGTFAPVFWDDPVIAGRLRFENDDLIAQVSAGHHRLKLGGANTILARFGRNRQERVSGWATSFGLTKMLPQVSDGSEFSMQATYAVNASPYLGTTADLSAFSALVPAPSETRGWSLVASYHHVWSEHWETNVMASHLALDLDLQRRTPAAKSTRYAVNLIWKPVENLQIGGELGRVDFTLRTNGAAQIFPIEGGSALVSYLFVTWSF
jgi:hypothetical protein